MQGLCGDRLAKVSHAVDLYKSDRVTGPGKGLNMNPWEIYA